MSINSMRGAVEWALMVALVLGAVAIAQAQEDETQPEGRVVQIGEADAGQPAPHLPPPNHDGVNVPPPFQPGFPEQPRHKVPKYWIGLLGGTIHADHPLRAHVDIPENQGLLVANVVPDSPAAKAGLKKHDILLRANDMDLHDMRDLVEIVRTEGEKKGQITLEVLRHGDRETVYLTPEDRPAQPVVPEGGLGEGGFGGEFGLPGEGGLPGGLLGEFGGRLPLEFRQFGPGVIVGGGGGMGFANMPNGVSVTVQKPDGQPAHITVNRGEETWEIVGDDPESLNQLPQDLRPFVEQMLRGGSPMPFNIPLPGPRPGRGFGDQQLQERLEQMERRMEELQRRLMGPHNPPTDQPKDQNDQPR